MSLISRPHRGATEDSSAATVTALVLAVLLTIGFLLVVARLVAELD